MSNSVEKSSDEPVSTVKSLWPIALIIAGVAASILWVIWLGWWVANAMASLI